MTVLLLTLVFGTSSVARGDPVVYYLALGDSLAAGVQPPSEAYWPGGMNTGDVHRGYADQLYARLLAQMPNLRLVKLGCGGERTTTMILGPCPSARDVYPVGSSQLDAAVAFLQDHPGEIALITIDLGANDIFRRCSIFNTTCVAAALPAIQANLATILQALQEAAPGVPIVGMSYYNPFLGLWVQGAQGQALAHLSAQNIGILNAALVAAYEGEGVSVADVAGAFAIGDFETMSFLPGVGPVPLNVARACDWTWFCAPPPLGPNIHANAEGYGVIAEAFAAVLSESALTG